MFVYSCFYLGLHPQRAVALGELGATPWSSWETKKDYAPASLDWTVAIWFD